jgi:hypothetical protein
MKYNLLHVAVENEAAGFDAWLLGLSLPLGGGLSWRRSLR